MHSDITPEMIEKFWSRVDRSGGPDACWPWQGATISNGYGNLRWQGESQLSHRVAFLIVHGHRPTPCGLHRCDNRICCNPNHISEGTYADNNADARQKGRAVNLSGEKNGYSKLTEDQVRDIRSRCEAKENYGRIAEDHGIARTCVSKVCKRYTWRHVL